jgi:hypothetical protein
MRERGGFRALFHLKRRPAPLPLLIPQLMRLRVIRARRGLSNILQHIIDLKAQIAKELSDQAVANEKYGVVITVG